MQGWSMTDEWIMDEDGWWMMDAVWCMMYEWWMDVWWMKDAVWCMNDGWMYDGWRMRGWWMLYDVWMMDGCMMDEGWWNSRSAGSGSADSRCDVTLNLLTKPSLCNAPRCVLLSWRFHSFTSCLCPVDESGTREEGRAGHLLSAGSLPRLHRCQLVRAAASYNVNGGTEEKKPWLIIHDMSRGGAAQGTSGWHWKVPGLNSSSSQWSSSSHSLKTISSG